MNPAPKVKRITDRRYLKWIKQQECLLAIRGECIGITDAHHVKPVSLGGSDYTAVPLCRKHHDEVHHHAIHFVAEIVRLRQEYAALNIKPAKERKPRTCRPKVESYRISCSCGRKHVSKDLRFWCTKVRDYLVAEL